MKAFPRLLNAWIGERPYEEVAPLLGAAFGTIHAWRHGTSLPPATRVPALATALGVEVSRLRKIISRDRARRGSPSKPKIHSGDRIKSESIPSSVATSVNGDSPTRRTTRLAVSPEARS